MFANTFTTTVVAALTLFTTSATAAPSTDSLDRRADSGNCHYHQEAGQYCYTINISSGQNSGLCKGLNDNFKGQANCVGLTGWQCTVDGDTKTASFCTGLGCSAKNVQDVIWTATSPHLSGVSCVNP